MNQETFTSLPLTLPPLSLYIHIPWCIQKCPYCDFNSHKLKDKIPEKQYIDALVEDLVNDLSAYQIEKNARPLCSIFIGGGTPSLISPQMIGYLINQINRLIAFEPNIEITMEANPGTIEVSRFKDYVDQGVNRISIGVQSFDNDKLKSLGRIHDAHEAIKAANLAHDIGVKSFNLDLMHGLPNQTIEQALSDLDTLIDLNPPHLSWYQLTIEKNTSFYSKPPKLPNDDVLWEIFDKGHQKLLAAGYEQYEISGYSKPSYQCQHNLNYWKFGDYLGIGCGAHGKLTFADGRIIRTSKRKHPQGYLDINTSYLDETWNVALKDRDFEFFMNSFRLVEACPKALFTQRTGLAIDLIEKPIADLVKKGLLTETSTHWQLTLKGRLFFNDVIAHFI